MQGMTRWFAVALAGTLGVATSGGVAFAQRPAPGGLVDPKAPVVVALLPFRVNGPAEIGYLGQAVPDILATRLATLTPAEQGAVAAAMQRRGTAPVTEAVAREVGRESGAQFVVLGTLTAVGEHLSLDARILPVTSGRAATIYIQGESLTDFLTHVGSLALEIDKGISGVSAFLGSETDPEPAPGVAPRGTPSGAQPPAFERPVRSRLF